MSEYDTLISVARQARENAHAPYSNFRVGAALRATSGRVFGGSNVENATYGLTVCAERVAILKAISEGERGFDAISVVTDTDTLTPPCGACRQLIWEFQGQDRDHSDERSLPQTIRLLQPLRRKSRNEKSRCEVQVDFNSRALWRD